MWTCTNPNCSFRNEDNQHKCVGCDASKPYPTAAGELSSGAYAEESMESTAEPAPDVSSTDQTLEVASVLSDAGSSLEKATEDEVKEAIRRLCDECGKDDGHTRPLNVVLIGKPGAGKSEFINSTAAALQQDKWRQYADSGARPGAEAITIRTRRYLKCCDRNRYSDVLLPTLIDVAGLSDEGGAAMTELLTLLCYGHIKDSEAIMNVYNDCKNLTPQEVRFEYRNPHEDMRIDRVIFVATCEDSLPDQLMKCVRNVVKPPHDSPQRKEIPLFGVLTKKDKVNMDDPEFKKKREDFKRGLGLNEPRLLVCTNYCDNIDPNNERLEKLRPDLDLPKVKFFQQVCSGAMSVACDDDTLNVPGPLYPIEKKVADMGPMAMSFLASVVAAFVAYIAGILLLPSGGQGYEELREACLSGRVNDTAVCNDVPGESSPQHFWSLIAAVVVGLFVMIISQMFYKQRPPA